MKKLCTKRIYLFLYSIVLFPNIYFTISQGTPYYPVKTAVTNAESVVKTDIDVMAESIESGLQNDEIRKIYYRRRLTVEIWSILPGLSCLTR